MGVFKSFVRIFQQSKVRNGLFVVAIILLIFFSGLSYYRINKTIDSSEMVTHSKRVMLKIEEALSIVKDAETGQRGFFITEDSAFFQPAVAAGNRIDSVLTELQALVKDHKEQSENLHLYRSLINSRLDHLTIARSYRFSENYDPDSLRSLLFDGKMSMDSVRTQAEVMLNEEQKLLSDRIKTNQKYISSTPLYSLIITLILLTIIIVAFSILNRRYKQEQLMKEEIMDSEQKFKGLLESAPDAMIIADGNGAISLVNEQTGKLFGYKREELIGKPVELLMPLQFQQRHIEHRKNYFQHPTIRQMGEGMELFAKAKDGKEFPVEISLSHLQTTNGLLVLAAIRDVTEKKKAQQAIIESEKISTVADISRTIAHEIRNPLNNINLAAGILKEKLSDSKDYPEIETSLNIITRNFRRIDNLVKDLLYSGKTEKRNFKTVDLAEIVEEVLTLASDRIVLKGILIEKNFESHCMISADNETLKIALLNIIVNAVEAMSHGIGVLKIGIEKNGDMINFSIEDNGIGMTDRELEKMFEPYYTSKPNGLGVGLANVKTILQNHNATPEVTSEPGKGTRFVIIFSIAGKYDGLDAANEFKETSSPLNK